MSLVNYLGTYETLDQVWETYPEGGKEGDYLYIASVLKKWNKYTSAWVDATQEDVEGSTIMSLDEDVVVGSSTLINYLGRFETLENALNAFPEGGNEGDYVYVGNDIYAWDKYANEWVVSSDAPLEVAISEEDIIPNSNIFINYLGGFVDRDAVWQKYPEGGKVGDYLYIASDLHIWDKYICNWVAATPPDESSQIRPIEHLAQEGVVEYSENYINYLGVFESIEQAWETYPEGGKEGDYIIVDGEQLRWNKYTNNWGEYDPDASTPARPVATIYGDLHVHNDVIIGEDLYARILETFTTKKWVLEQGYISMDDVTSELVMSKIVPDNTTIEVRDGKLVVIGGGGGGTADSVAWDNITGKPDWIGNTKPTYTLDEIAGSNGDGFVTLLSDQTIEGVKNFAKGIQIEGMPMYRSKDDTVYLDANLVVRGGVTMYGSNLTTSPSIFEALPIDNDTIKRNAKGELYAVGGGGSGTGGGGVADSVAWSNVTNKPTWITDTKPKYSYSEILDTPDLSVYAIKSSVDNALSGKADKATTLAGYGITNAYTKSEVNATVDSINTSISNLRKYADDTFVTISTEQNILAVKDFDKGLKIGGISVSKLEGKDIIYIDANLVVRGGVTMYGDNGQTLPSIWASIPFDSTMKWDGSKWSVVGGGSGEGGLDLVQLEEYLTTNGYATQDWVTGKGYITSSALKPYALKTAIPTNTNQLTNGAGFITGITSSMVTNALGYTPLSTSGGTITGEVTITAAANSPLKINSNATDSGVYFNHNGISKTWVGFEASRGSVLYHSDGSHRLGINNNGVAFYDSNTLLHSGNYSDYALPKGGTAAAAWKLANSRYFWGQLFDGTSNIGGQLSFNAGDFILAHNATDAWTDGNGLTHPWYGIDFRAGGSYKGYISHWSGISLVSGNDITLASDKNVVVSNGKLRINQSAFSNGLTLNGTSANAGAGIVFQSNGSLLGQIGINGTKTFEVSDGTTIKASIEIPTGNLILSGVISMNQSSDERLKKNIRKVNASEVLMSLGGVWQYEYIDSEVQKNSVYDGTHFGLIYQNVKGKSLDKMCHKREDGMGALNYVDADFISIIAGATMENISEVEKLKRKIRTLENKVKQLEQVA